MRETGKKHLVLDLSCRKKDGDYYVVTDRWQKFTEMKLTPDILDELAAYCDEFLIHGVDVEGKQAGMEEGLTVYARTVGKAPGYIRRRHRLHEDLARFERMTGGSVDFTIGSALDLFGGSIPYDKVRAYKC